MTFWLMMAGFAVWTVAALVGFHKSMGREAPPAGARWLLDRRRDRAWVVVVLGLAGLGAGLLAADIVRGQVAAHQGTLGGPVFLLVPLGGTALGAALAALARRA
jgi:hypothetical protein